MRYAIMKTLVAVFLGLALALSTNVAAAYVVVVGAAVPIAPAVAEDSSRLSDAVRSAIRDVLAHVVAFTPTVVTIQNARVVGDRLYILLFIANEDGEATIEALSTNGNPPATPDPQDRSAASAPGSSVPSDGLIVRPIE
jgi:hypothetical protein